LLHVKAAARFLRTELLRSFQEDCETTHDDDDDDGDKFRKCGSWDRGKNRASERGREGRRFLKSTKSRRFLQRKNHNVMLC
jgi:hypothetical protein